MTNVSAIQSNVLVLIIDSSISGHNIYNFQAAKIRNLIYIISSMLESYSVIKLSDR